MSHDLTLLCMCMIGRHASSVLSLDGKVEQWGFTAVETSDTSGISGMRKL